MEEPLLKIICLGGEIGFLGFVDDGTETGGGVLIIGGMDIILFIHIIKNDSLLHTVNILTMSYHYWDDDFKTDKNESLQECLNLYGTQVVRHPSGYKYKVIFLDDARDLGNSWMLWSKTLRGKNIPVKLYEEHKTLGKK
jgi:hypothetical protein